jgi:DNA-binding transcriptional MocR family regulator
VNHYARIPVEVLFDSRISDQAKLVYCALAMSVFQGSVAFIGQRLIADRFGVSQSTVSRRLRELEKVGHIRRMAGKRGYRAHWALTSVVFGQKQGKVTEVVSSPSGGLRYASVEEVA